MGTVGLSLCAGTLTARTRAVLYRLACGDMHIIADGMVRRCADRADY